jgi:hypothetical protein
VSAKSVKAHSISIRSDMGSERNHRALASGVSSRRSCETEPVVSMAQRSQVPASFSNAERRLRCASKRLKQGGPSGQGALVSFARALRPQGGGALARQANVNAAVSLERTRRSSLPPAVRPRRPGPDAAAPRPPPTWMDRLLQSRPQPTRLGRISLLFHSTVSHLLRQPNWLMTSPSCLRKPRGQTE